MGVVQALILGVVQGLTEALPISSSGHLVILPLLFGWKEQPLVFDTTLHLGTALALLIYFFKDLWAIFIAFVKDFFSHYAKIKNYSEKGYLGVLLLVGCIPAALLGFLFNDLFETTFRSLTAVAIFLLVGSALMLFAEKFSKKTDAKLTVKKSLFIGFMQSLALFPGVSRSGATISAGMLAGLNREEAARFSFLLSVPIVVMAGVFKLVTSFNLLSSISILPILVGFVASTLFGILAIEILLRFVRKNNLTVFIVYRIALAVFLLVLALK